MLAARADYITAHVSELQKVLSVVHEAAVSFRSERNYVIGQVVERFHIKKEDAESWSVCVCACAFVCIYVCVCIQYSMNWIRFIYCTKFCINSSFSV